MGGAPRNLVRALGALALAGLLAGCASPIGIRTADPQQVQRYLTQSALTDSKPSLFSQNQLRRYDLLDFYRVDPDNALATLHTAALADGFPPNALFALAELSFLRAQQEDLQAGYAMAVIYAYAMLFPEEERARVDPLDPRERIAADIYNRALTSAFRRTAEGTLALDGTGEFPLPIGMLHLSAAPDMLRLSGSELYDLKPVAEIQVYGLRNRYRRPGIGAPLAARTRPIPGVVQVVPVPESVRVPLTAVVRIERPLAALREGQFIARLYIYASLDTESIELEGRDTPLEAEPTASLAAGLAESRFWKQEIQTFLGDAIGLRKESALAGLRPYKQGRIPVVFVHGTASSPARWANMINDLLADPRLRERYAYWLFSYDSGNPIAFSGYQLRKALSDAALRADPEGDDPCIRDMVVMGHSQGGLLTKLTVIDSGDAFWKNVSSRPFDQVRFDPDDKQLLKDVLFVKPLPFVTEVIFLATPQQGSYLAGPQLVRRMAAYFVRLPSDVVRVSTNMATYAAAGDTDIALTRMPTSIDNMSPGNPFIKTIAKISVSPPVISHSIIAVQEDGPLEDASDGVVKYQSAHVEGVESEKIVRSPHSGMQDAPVTIEEVRRILIEHSERSACPMPEE